MWGGYGASKLANLLTALELARRAGPDLLVHSCTPGMVNSGEVV
jgi:NAD(P)-dependent dehydrogenase (short-subunit alcohol dehydrogenase family)